MVHTIFDKIKLIGTIYKQLTRLPNMAKPVVFFKPCDATRYDEFLFLLKFLKNTGYQYRNVLDVSSPFVMSYLLSQKAQVVKTDINPQEAKWIKQDANLKFELANATALLYPEHSFDLVYSISVIEHIYQDYLIAINEMIRVCRPGGIIYITFPVAKNHTEEWITDNIYSNQHKTDKKVFFQYRFDKYHYRSIIDGIDDADLEEEYIYWEKKDGSYDRMTQLIRKKLAPFFLNSLKNMLVHLFYGFTMFESSSGTFNDAKSFGNVSLILRKKSL